jgi:hypothetical protein
MYGQLRHDGDRHELSGIEAELGKEALADHQRPCGVAKSV